LQEFDRLSTFRESFAIETTLSGLVYINRFKFLKAKGYRLEIIYLDLKDSGLAVKRVKARVREGGHGISPKEIRRRFFRSRKNFLHHYIHLADAWHHYDNSGREPILINKSW
jgi:predicted ABC-type ATPase